MTPPAPICDITVLQLIKEIFNVGLMRSPTFLRTQMITFLCISTDTYLKVEYKFCGKN